MSLIGVVLTGLLGSLALTGLAALAQDSTLPILSDATVVRAEGWVSPHKGWECSSFKSDRAVDGLLSGQCLFSCTSGALAMATVQLASSELYDIWARVYDDGSEAGTHDFTLTIRDEKGAHTFPLAVSDYDSPYHVENTAISNSGSPGGYIWERMGPLVTEGYGKLQLELRDPDLRGSALDALVFYHVADRKPLACDFSIPQDTEWSTITRGQVISPQSSFHQEKDPSTGQLCLVATIGPTDGPGLNGDQWLSVLSQHSLSHRAGEPFSFHIRYRVDDHYLGQDNYLGVLIDSSPGPVPSPCLYGTCHYNNLLYDSHQPTWSLFNDGFFHWKQLSGGECVLKRDWDFIIGYGTDQLNYLVPGATDLIPPNDPDYPLWSITDYHVYSFFFNGQEGLAYIDGRLADRWWVPDVIRRGSIEREDLNPTFMDAFNKEGYIRFLFTALGDGRDPFAEGMPGYMECTCPQTPAVYDRAAGIFVPKTAKVYLDWAMLNADLEIARKWIDQGRLPRSTANPLGLTLPPRQRYDGNPYDRADRFQQ